MEGLHRSNSSNEVKAYFKSVAELLSPIPVFNPHLLLSLTHDVQNVTRPSAVTLNDG